MECPASDIILSGVTRDRVRGVRCVFLVRTGKGNSYMSQNEGEEEEEN